MGTGAGEPCSLEGDLAACIVRLYDCEHNCNLVHINIERLLRFKS